MNFESDERNLPQKISEDIISFILNEHLQPGDKLPNEAHLAKELNIGRSSLREAMKLLASRNIVTIRQGSGTYVASSPGVVDDPLGFTFIPDKKSLSKICLKSVFYWSQLSQLCLQRMQIIMILRKLFLCVMRLKSF
ncbi:GntR family transcriptional regulator, transcriptional repressor for pyruvate dehydrogenase complex (plasmid) [Lachnospira eligens ATCC 27750]|uniref:GntR family transcriptional regulator, transcriptional repressor for pyruvate dehydrogenase complex n=1 Tax=Lachnospira eligens (strain ATCC 27750 / DSM 3376 / VPI C15-48 / C15-B4) TaxID=515620 RepID=C4Z7S3_LACE2|nr:GntR family transcriptional regulator, transcriptional repressor for pyruvate dehydrogenase complex [[Eubacterium] eligens ATCC 27750]